MPEDKTGSQKEKINSHGIRVFLGAENDPGIKPEGWSVTELRDM
jgi:hypothetical protein